MWVATLVGKDVYNEFVIAGVCETMNIGLAQITIEKRFKVKFEQDDEHSVFGHRIFNNVSDNRDIKLIISITNIIK